jgi:hypothetical protein
VVEELLTVSELTSDNHSRLRVRARARMRITKPVLMRHRKRGFAGSCRWLSMTRKILLKVTQTRKTAIGLFDDSGKEWPHDHDSALCGSATNTKVISL